MSNEMIDGNSAAREQKENEELKRDFDSDFNNVFMKNDDENATDNAYNDYMAGNL